jgi:phosphoribosyl-dephospho-CoA transferase
MVSPAELVSGSASALSGASPASNAPTQARLDFIPALRSLAALSQHQGWKSLQHRWGPGGSVGFELTTARHTATPQSDLDIVIYADERLSAEEAKRLLASTQNLPSAVDVRVETPFCGFSLTEYASRTPAAILLRTVSGTMLGTDPWEVCPSSGLAAARLAPTSPP